MTQREKDSAILHENLMLLDRRLLREVKKRIPLITDPAMPGMASAESDTNGTADLHTLQHSLRRFFDSPTGETDEAALPFLSAVKGTVNTADRVAYIQAYLSMREHSERPLQLAELLPIAQPSKACITYVRNAYTDEAYETFADIVHSATVHYTDSFREACNAVATKEADFCILPYRHTGGSLPSFSELAARYSLYVCALCRVYHADGTDVTTFALYGRNLLPQEDDGTVYLRCSFLAADAATIACHMHAAGILGIALEDVQAVPCAEQEGMLLCSATLLPKKNILLPWLAYLFAFADGAACQGLYKEI